MKKVQKKVRSSVFDYFSTSTEFRVIFSMYAISIRGNSELGGGLDCAKGSRVCWEKKEARIFHVCVNGNI